MYYMMANAKYIGAENATLVREAIDGDLGFKRQEKLIVDSWADLAKFLPNKVVNKVAISNKKDSKTKEQKDEKDKRPTELKHIFQ